MATNLQHVHLPPLHAVLVESVKGHKTIRQGELCEIGIDRLTQSSVVVRP